MVAPNTAQRINVAGYIYAADILTIGSLLRLLLLLLLLLLSILAEQAAAGSTTTEETTCWLRALLLRGGPESTETSSGSGRGSVGRSEKRRLILLS